MYNKDSWGDFTDFKGWHSANRARRGDMKPIILRILLKKPMHGYEIISQLEEKSHGMWRPSPGSVYPTLQLLVDQDLVSCEESSGKKIYTLTDKGKEEAAAAEEYKAPWEERVKSAKKFKDLKHVLRDCVTSIKDIASQNNEHKDDEVRKIIIEARDKLNKLANQDN